MPLSSLTQWSHEHIAKIFTAINDEDCLRALEETFARDVKAKLNDRRIGFEDIKRSVMLLRKESLVGHGLRVHWEHGVEVAYDSNKYGTFGGAYVIRGIHRMVEGQAFTSEFERRKSVVVTIESQDSTHPGIDSRRIVAIVFVAADVQVIR